MPQNLTNEKSTAVKVMAWRRQATCHYHFWPTYISPYGIIKPQWVLCHKSFAIGNKHRFQNVMMTSSNGNSSVLLTLCAGKSPVTGEFPEQRPVTWSFDVFFDLRLNKRLSKQSWDWWFETQSCSLWRHCNVLRPGLRQHGNWLCYCNWRHQQLSKRQIADTKYRQCDNLKVCLGIRCTAITTLQLRYSWQIFIYILINSDEQIPLKSLRILEYRGPS